MVGDDMFEAADQWQRHGVVQMALRLGDAQVHPAGWAHTNALRRATGGRS